MKNKLCIATLPPTYYGGILSMMTYAYNVALSEYDPQLCYLSNKRYYKDKFVNTLYKLVKGSYQEEVFRDMNGIAVDSPISLLHCMQYADVKGTWNEVLEKFDVFFCVGGSSHSAYPLYKSGKKYSIWIATPYADDRIDRIADYSLIKKTQEAISFPFDMKMEREILHSAHKVLALSEYTKNKIIEYYSLEPEQIIVAPYPVDTGLFYPDESQKKTDKIHIIFTARYNDPRKNIKMLLESFSIALEKSKNLHLHLIGELPSKKIKDIIEKLNIEDKVTCVDRLSVDQLVKLYQQCHIFVIPSNQEGLCISGLEAMSCGLPVISTKCGGPEEFVIDGENGFLVEVDDPDEFAQRLVALVTDDSLVKKMSASARDTVIRSYSKELIDPIFINAFRELSQ